MSAQGARAARSGELGLDAFATWRDRLRAYEDGALHDAAQAELETALSRSKALRAERAAIQAERAAQPAAAPAAPASDDSVAGMLSPEDRAPRTGSKRARARIDDLRGGALSARDDRGLDRLDAPHAIDRRVDEPSADRSRDRRAARRPAVESRSFEETQRKAGGRAVATVVAATLAMVIGFGGGLYLAATYGDPGGPLDFGLSSLGGSFGGAEPRVEGAAPRAEAIDDVAASAPTADLGEAAPAAAVADESSAPPWALSVAIAHRLVAWETLESAPLSSAALDRRLSRISDALAMNLIPAAEAPRGLSLRQAQLLNLDGQPMAQILFAGPNRAVLALSVIPRDGAVDAAGPTAFESARLIDLNAVSWDSGAHSFLLIGAASDRDLRVWAAAFAMLLARPL